MLKNLEMALKEFLDGTHCEHYQKLIREETERVKKQDKEHFDRISAKDNDQCIEDKAA
jgi:hypothetical protein